MLMMPVNLDLLENCKGYITKTCSLHVGDYDYGNGRFSFKAEGSFNL